MRILTSFVTSLVRSNGLCFLAVCDVSASVSYCLIDMWQPQWFTLHGCFNSEMMHSEPLSDTDL